MPCMCACAAMDLSAITSGFDQHIDRAARNPPEVFDKSTRQPSITCEGRCMFGSASGDPWHDSTGLWFLTANEFARILEATNRLARSRTAARSGGVERDREIYSPQMGRLVGIIRSIQSQSLSVRPGIARRIADAMEAIRGASCSVERMPDRRRNRSMICFLRATGNRR